MGIPQHYYEGQAQELSSWVESRKRERRVQIQPAVKTEEIRTLETAMTAIGVAAAVIAVLAILALLAYWVSPWMVVIVLTLIAAVWLWSKYKRI